MFSAQRDFALRIVSEYRTVSTSSVLVLVSVPPIDLLANERQETDSSSDGRRDGMVNRPRDGPTV